MAKERHHLDTTLYDTSVSIPVTTTIDDTKKPDMVSLVISIPHALVRLESWPLFTRLVINGHDYCFDHVTGNLLKEKEGYEAFLDDRFC